MEIKEILDIFNKEIECRNTGITDDYVCLKIDCQKCPYYVSDDLLGKAEEAIVKYFESRYYWGDEKQPEIIRCSECTYFKDRAVTVGYCEKKMMYQYKDYFCKEAKRRIE